MTARDLRRDDAARHVQATATLFALSVLDGLLQDPGQAAMTGDELDALPAEADAADAAAALARGLYRLQARDLAAEIFLSGSMKRLVLYIVWPGGPPAQEIMRAYRWDLAACHEVAETVLSAAHAALAEADRRMRATTPPETT